MKKNIGFTDRAIRIIVAIVILALYATEVINGALALVLLLVMGVFLITSFFNFCPLYFTFGISTRRKR